MVTGGLGFIGSHLAVRLVELGAAVTIADSLVPRHGGNPYNIREIADRVEVIHADLRDTESSNRLVRGQDFIFNLAGQVSHLDSMEDPLTDLDINVKGHLCLLEACVEHSPEARVVFAASRQQYGRPRFLPVTEDHPLAPVDVNGVNITAAEAYHLLYYPSHGLRAVSLRLTNTYGPHLLVKHAHQGFIALFIRSAIEGETIAVYGDGSQLRDFTYVSDVVEAFLSVALVEQAFGHAFNVGGLEPVSVLEVGSLCQRLAGKGGSIEAVSWPRERASIDVGSTYLDYSKLTDLTAWRPTIALDDGLRKTIDFYRAHGDHYWT